MSNRKAGELTKYLMSLSHLGFTKDDERVVKIINEIEKELELFTSTNSIKVKAKDTNKALVVAIKDCSGSVGIIENQYFSEYYNLALNEIKQKYNDVKELFIHHHTEAKQVLKEQFFLNGESGGTIVSSALKELIKHLDTDREVIVIQFSDGDNLTSDCVKAFKLLNEEILPSVKYFKYFEANQYNRHSTLIHSAYKHIKNLKFDYIVALEKDHSLKGVRFGQELNNLKG